MRSRGRIFDPFFTTRPIGEGMGLGLAVCKTIVDSIGGEIELDSTPGRGTVVTLVLRVHRGAAANPAAGAARDVARTPAAASRRARDPLGVRARVLIVDDERFVRDALARLLADTYDVTVAGSGDAALTELARATFDTIVCDVLMPGMDGRELYHRIAAEYPGLERRIVFMSGGTFAADLDAFLARNGCLSKPFKVDEVVRAIDACRERS